ncbi:Histone deacetylase complex subunit, variant 2 [Purpureocillium takamizusanense]|uniref:Histone deacetylase complex subunit, variant 2 n=1 Tax=Purpureocillium takamizusanense TaxID=2060973 RepID=A0A9Q8QTF2_9HYPO|nr:Histone deacetylase complex subunit, variant 2 [Purpureocillium takamizusanense]UNI24127.1 Histone deacetylase complex subunit, variant 2 [Purpureocillium takamizusanense]
MAPPSPRRSSRARATNSQSQQSSVSSGTSGRHERSTRSHQKPPSGKSTPSASLSSEPLDDLDDTLLSRRRKRGQDDDPERPPRVENTIIMANGAVDLQDEEDEAVRCICGSEDYPGRPPVEGPDADFFAGIELTEEVTGFFVQCDVCKVWQHGACVGIFSAEASPDEYFCEQCRKDLHRIHTASNGQKYSKYLPLHQASRTTSRATSIAKDGTRSPKPSGSKRERPNSASQAAAKRRSTMNSRDAAYDDELLRRVIEASKEDAPPDTSDTASRRAKRGRSDSEELVSHTSQAIDTGLTSHRNGTNAKRQRTGSRSVSPAAAELPDANGGDASDDDSSARNGAKKSRNVRSQREKSEKEDKEQQRQEAANKRKGRAERRRAEGRVFRLQLDRIPEANAASSRLRLVGRNASGSSQGRPEQERRAPQRRGNADARTAAGHAADEQPDRHIRHHPQEGRSELPQEGQGTQPVHQGPRRGRRVAGAVHVTRYPEKRGRA